MFFIPFLFIFVQIFIMDNKILGYTIEAKDFKEFVKGNIPAKISQSLRIKFFIVNYVNNGFTKGKKKVDLYFELSQMIFIDQFNREDRRIYTFEGIKLIYIKAKK